ncbi:Cys/Met metabolism PLP-dependent enzyme [Chitinophaga terrae (ex Kim and Jung 2007)]|uniref:Cys/Met metabolism PLP-dependent enzyme n=1 Tax=Chitinophaga terrae (ex Kim and Jung 2007) TaxID=408074 RepID=A0A1H4FCJ7_9BACT|nr:cystathionine gamma-synthase [Chitinophaga terrae (ex Kim and Jung 2007)]GEP92271.1 cystathionine beta-lyase [Chitinophaga terrae (ex Kim and Jung 2007)]SEA94222.1 Cys/Met metabolism PLP-dependent enzyme [Chitinophaga terrae (ex Kim and Jung 2007)]
MKPGTKFIHAGVAPDPSTGAIMTPIFQTSTYVQDGPGVHKGYEYARTQNPTRDALQKALAAIENGSHGISFGSGMAATDAVMKLLKPGDEVLATNDLYGGSYRIFTKIYEPLGIRFKFIDMSDAATISQHLSSQTRMIWIETPTNPLLKIIDIAACAEIAAAHKALLVVDNTFASPYLQNPLDLGADIVVHSATKYLGGHSDVVHGAVIVKDEALAQQLYFIQNSCGAVPGPQDCFLVLRGIKTLHVRMQRHCENGAAIAQFLRNHSKVDKVYWPGFADHPNHAIAATQMRNFGGMISFTLKDDRLEAANRVLSNTHLFSLAESLGGVESLIGHPASMTHASIPREERLRNGLADSLIRLSVGIEDADDLIDDLDKAIE